MGIDLDILDLFLLNFFYFSLFIHYATDQQSTLCCFITEHSANRSLSPFGCFFAILSNILSVIWMCLASFKILSCVFLLNLFNSNLEFLKVEFQLNMSRCYLTYSTRIVLILFCKSPLEERR